MLCTGATEMYTGQHRAVEAGCAMRKHTAMDGPMHKVMPQKVIAVESEHNTQFFCEHCARVTAPSLRVLVHQHAHL